MTVFIIIAVILVAAALAWLLIPLLRHRGDATGVAREASNLAILKHQIAELEVDRAANTLSDEQYRHAKAELERRVLEETGVSSVGAAAKPRSGNRTAMALGVAVPVFAALLYAALGSHDAFSPQQASGGDHAVTRDQVEAMVARLAMRLEQQPDDAQGWSVLARSYYVMERFPDAAKAYAKLAELEPDNANVLADYADALAMAQGRQLSGKPLELAKRAIEINPNHWKALAIAGTEAFERKDYKHAIAYWERAQRSVPPESEIAKSMAENVAEARQLAGLSPGEKAAVSEAKRTTSAAAGAKSAAAAASVKGTVTLSPSLAGRADPTDTVFIFARAADGPRVPLAVVKRQVKDLPATFTLDDSLAMAPNMKLSGFQEVIVGARISKSADATTRPGDLQGQSAPVKVGANNVAVVIDRVAP